MDVGRGRTAANRSSHHLVYAQDEGAARDASARSAPLCSCSSDPISHKWHDCGATRNTPRKRLMADCLDVTKVIELA